jgi:hypothetical protein
MRKHRVNASTIIKRLFFSSKNTSLVDKEALLEYSGFKVSNTMILIWLFQPWLESLEW